MKRILSFTVGIVLLVAVTSTIYAEDLDLKVHQGMWSSCTTSPGEYFLGLQFYTNGHCDFTLAHRNPETPHVSPHVAEYRGVYIVDGSNIKLTLDLEPEAKIEGLPAAVNTVLAVQSHGELMTVTLLDGDPLFAGFWNGAALLLVFYRYP